jgi:hypothetical protein
MIFPPHSHPIFGVADINIFRLSHFKSNIRYIEHIFWGILHQGALLHIATISNMRINPETTESLM